MLHVHDQIQKAGQKKKSTRRALKCGKEHPHVLSRKKKFRRDDLVVKSLSRLGGDNEHL